jgi:segregation and condensation protein A
VTGTSSPSIEGYQLRLPSFEGPLDVLLGLIERERLDISNLSLVTVTDGFVAYVRGLRDAPPALLAEFAGIAARLLVLKSRALLPRPAAVDEAPDLDDLAELLREYQRAKAAAEQLRAAEQRGWRSYARLAAAEAPPPRIVFVVPPVAHLRRALARTLARRPGEPETRALTPQVSIGEMIARLRSRLTGLRFPQPFRRLVGPDRDETVAGFIALLALWRRGEIVATQHTVFGEILVTPHASMGSVVAALDD